MFRLQAGEGLRAKSNETDDDSLTLEALVHRHRRQAAAAVIVDRGSSKDTMTILTRHGHELHEAQNDGGTRNLSYQFLLWHSGSDAHLKRSRRKRHFCAVFGRALLVWSR